VRLLKFLMRRRNERKRQVLAEIEMVRRCLTSRG
jgi:hypothetical protein